MKTNVQLSHFRRCGFLLVLLTFVLLFGINSCQKKEEIPAPNAVQLKNGTIPQGNIVTYWGHETFTRSAGEPVIVKKKIGSADLQHFEPSFTLYIQNGDGTKNLVSSAIVKLDGKQIFGPSDFSQSVKFLSKDVSGLTENSDIEVEIRGIPGSFVDVWIEGTLLPGHAYMTTKGGDYSLLNGQISLNIPENAIDKPVFISVRNITNEIPEQLKSKLTLVYEFLPDGLEFNIPLDLKIKIPNDIPIENARVFGQLFIDSGYLMWINAKVNKTERIVSTQLKHFSKWSMRHLGDFCSRTSPYTYNLISIPRYISVSNYYLLKNDVFRSFSRWESYTKNIGIEFSETNLADPDITVRFIDEEDAALIVGDPGFDDQFRGTPAMALWDLNSEQKLILLNKSASWSRTGFVDGTLNIERVVSHEISHYFGMSDGNVKIGIMANPDSEPEGLQTAKFPLSVCKQDLDFLESKYPNIRYSINFATAYTMKNETSSTQDKVVGSVLKDAIKVKIKDYWGNGIPNVTVVFKSYSNTTNGIVGYDTKVVLTDPYGIATFPEFTLPNYKGTFLVTTEAYFEPYKDDVGEWVVQRSEKFKVNLIDGENTGLVAYYPFNGNTNDESGNGNSGTNNGATLTTDRHGNANRAYSFDGINDGIMISQSSTLNTTSFKNGYTVAAWIKSRDLGSFYYNIASIGDMFCIRLCRNWSEACHHNTVGYSCQAGNGQYIELNKWFFIAITWDESSGTWQKYLDGSKEYYTGSLQDLVSTSNYAISIGRDNMLERWFFNGVIDDVRIYNRALTEQEIKSLYFE